MSIPVAIPGLYITGIATGDFDGDGKPDLAFSEVSNTGGDVFVLLGRGDGSFQPPVDTTLPFQIQAIAAGDFDEDGRSDVAVPSSNFGGKVTVLLSSGDGSFSAPTSYAVGTGSTALTAANLRGSGHLDLIVGNDASSAIAVLPGNGHGAFGAPVRYAVGKPTFALLAADFDHDGNMDIVTADGYVGTATVLLGLGNGAFRAPISLFAGYPFLMVGGDFDGNGYLDLVFSDSDSVRGALTVLLNGALTASTASASVVVSTSASLHVNATGFGTLDYQWRKDGVPLSDGGPISGATTATLTIDPVAFTDAGSYDVLVTDSCGSTTSNAATLSVEFDDVPLDNPFHNDILTIATAGITGGCTDTSYCPANPVSRAEMAVFLLKSKYGADHVPPPPPPVPIFPDVPADAFAAAWIDELATLEITTGCGDGLYCPDRSVSRAEMAVFLLKTLLGSGYVPPTPAGIFADVPLDYFAIAWIEDLYNRGVTAGCGTNPLRYCPDAIVPREQMATFLVRTFLGP